MKSYFWWRYTWFLHHSANVFGLLYIPYILSSIVFNVFSLYLLQPLSCSSIDWNFTDVGYLKMPEDLLCDAAQVFFTSTLSYLVCICDYQCAIPRLALLILCIGHMAIFVLPLIVYVIDLAVSNPLISLSSDYHLRLFLLLYWYTGDYDYISRSVVLYSRPLCHSSTMPLCEVVPVQDYCKILIIVPLDSESYTCCTHWFD